MFLGGAFVDSATMVPSLSLGRLVARSPWLAFLVANLVPVRLPTTILAAAASCWMAVAMGTRTLDAATVTSWRR